MKNKHLVYVLFTCFLGLLLASCDADDMAEYAAPVDVEYNLPAATQEPEVNDPGITYNTLGSDSLTVSQRSDRLIIKNADITLLVDNTDTAIDRTTQIVGDVGGYIISSRTWYQDWGKEQFKFSTITIGVPSNQFEYTLRRLRDIAIQILDENASGEDVTEEYVDLQSRLDNLIATRDRIRGFLEEARNVEEALKVNNELSKVEGQIEEIQGRMNYLSDRAAYSTITITIEPELMEIPTPTPIPTSTPTPWNPGETFNDAKQALTNTYRGLFDIAVWLLVVVIPVIGPFIVIGWLLWRLFTRRSLQRENKKADKT